jgi:hypothetical protein
MQDLFYPYSDFAAIRRQVELNVVTEFSNYKPLKLK